MSDGPDAHSADYLERTSRDFWWNEDFLALTVRRLGLDDVASLLDVGCGLGHWTRALSNVLPELEEAVGVDAEQDWSHRYASPFVHSAAVQADGIALPFADDSFDLVSCQTLLIHVPEPTAVVRDMKRVTRPGGTVFVAEPSNRASMSVTDTVSTGWTVEKRVRHMCFWETCSAGKIALGRGDISAGDRLPSFFTEAGFSEISLYLSDKAGPLWPPYASDEQQAWVADSRNNSAAGRSNWSEEEARELFVAGGGKPDQFETTWNEWLSDDREVVKAINSMRYASSGGSMTYVAAAQKTPLS